MATTKPSTDINLTAFEILEAVTGELPCYASPNWKVSDKREEREDPPQKNTSKSPSRAEGPNEKARN